MAELSRENVKYLLGVGKKGGGYAFPFIFDQEDGVFASSGLTKRELFAAMAMYGLLANAEFGSDPAYKISEYAIDQADSLIEALNEPQSDQGQSES